MDDLVDTKGIAERLGLKAARTVHSWRRRHTDFPSPAITTGSAMLWSWPEVEAWARRTGRLT